MFCPSSLLSKFTLNSDSKLFVDGRILDVLAQRKIPEKNRKIEATVKSILQHTSVQVEKVIKTIMSDESLADQSGSAKGNVAVALKIMQQLTLRGANYLP